MTPRTEDPVTPRMPDEGAPAPASSLELETDAGTRLSLASLRGRPVVLYFYPKDDTPGCTTEACEFRDAWADVQRTGAVVLGVSPDGATSHVKFRRKYQLPFPLLADPEHRLADAWGVWGEKSMFGHRYQGVHRTTFIIGPDGHVARVFRSVKPRGHAAQVLAALAGFSPKPAS